MTRKNIITIELTESEAKSVVRTFGFFEKVDEVGDVGLIVIPNNSRNDLLRKE